MVVILKKELLKRSIFLCILLTALTTCMVFAFSFPEIKQNFNHLYDGPEKIVYLTFDDGPTSKITPKVLDILKKQEVKANFFLLGMHVEQYPEIVKREYEEGHFLANHGYSHNNDKLYANKESFIEEIQNTDHIIGKAIGDENFISHVFRFPNRL